MADLERGKRIKELRQRKAERLGRRVTQQAMADHTGVSLRAAQEWEYGGGIEDDHLPMLLEFLETDSNYLLRGETPDLFAETADPRTYQLDRIEKAVEEILRRLTEDDAEDVPDALPPAPNDPPDAPDEDEQDSG